MSVMISMNRTASQDGVVRAVAIPVRPVSRRWRRSMLDMRDSLFVLVYQLTFQLMTLFRRWNY